MDGLRTLPARLRRRCAASPDAIAFHHRAADGSWPGVTWGTVQRRVDALAVALLRLGLRPGGTIAIMLPTTPVWELCHHAALAAGAAVVGLDAHDAPANHRHILELVRPQVLVVQDSGRLAALRAAWDGPAVAVLADPDTAPGCEVHRLDDLLAGPSGPLALPPDDPDRIATIVFTSGSTGLPKGIPYTHHQVALACDAILGRFTDIHDDARLACWLPLSNLFQRIINLCAIERGARSYFVERPQEIGQLLPEIGPTLFIGVPRFFEKLHAGILARVAARPAAQRLLLRAAWAVGVRAARERAVTGRGGPWGWLLPLANPVLRRVRLAMGPRLRFLVSGSAPMPGWLLQSLDGLGWTVLEAYGISEDIVPVAMNSPGISRPGSVGLPLSGNAVRLAADGELQVRGPGVFTGYHGEAGADGALTADGFLRTGDLARIDSDGYIWLLGRAGDMFKTSTGRRIVPAPIEAALLRLGFVDHAVVVGRGRPFPVALLTLDVRHPLLTVGDADGLRLHIAAAVREACSGLPEAQQPGAVVCSRRPLSIAAGELTANLKPRRASIEERFAEAIATACTPGRRHDGLPCVVEAA